MSVDKSKILEAKVVSQNERMQYVGMVEGQEQVSIDYTTPIGDDNGYTSLELLLLSLSSCVASTLGAMLRSNGSIIKKIECAALGTRRKSHPTGFEKILLDLSFESNNLNEDDVNKVIAVAKEGICPVWCMLKSSVDITVKCNINRVGN